MPPSSRPSSTVLLQTLRADGTISTGDAPWLAADPPALAVSRDRVEGMLLGVAIGDALGRPSEASLPKRRRRLYGEVRDYHRHYRAKKSTEPARGEPSDDTQLTFWALDQMVADGGLDPEALSERYAREGRYLIGIGATVKAFRTRAAEGLPWTARGVGSAGNGALMRAPAFLLPHLRAPSPALWSDAALAAFVTHNDSASTASCVAFTAMLWDLLGMDAPPAPGWWVETFLARAAPLEVSADYTPRGGDDVETFKGTLCDRVRNQIGGLADDARSIEEICNAMHSGAYLLETVPCALLILARCAHDPEEAIVRAVNDTKDNDTVAAIVGAAVGALHGRAALPARWIEGLSGRLKKRGEAGVVFDILARGCDAFCP